MSLPKPYEARFESFQSTGLIIELRLRLLGRDHRLNGTVIVREDIGNNFYISGETYNDATGSGNYKEVPFSSSNIPFCKFLDDYSKYFAASMVYGKNTDCPYANHTCPLPKGEYYVKDVILKDYDWPHIMPRGFFKANGKFERDNEVVGTSEVVIRFTDRTWR
ncbi:hypothetical protein KR032_011393 [Drosophila birchii]|nr:hypothetical protein KR032_011393 [Drosophila birchii]